MQDFNCQTTDQASQAQHSLLIRGKLQRGFTIIEALIALLIMTFGLLAASGMQMSLSRNSDVSKQRTEAMRLAQEKVEYLRSFSQITTATNVLSWDGLSASSDTTTTNATYTRTWSLGGSANDTHRAISVAVSWVDRTGETQRVTVTSVVSQTNPSDTGFLGFPLPENTTLKRVKDRSLDIPVPAIALTGSNAGKSAYVVGSNLSVIFDNYNGNVVKNCNFTITTTTADISSCSTLTAVILAGYVTDGSYSTSTSCSGTGRSRTCTTVVTAGTTGVDTSGITGNSSSITCAYGDATNSSTGATISGYKYYLCVIPLTDLNSSWSGTVKIKGISKTSNYVNCRFQYINSSLTNNQRNVQPYSSVSDSLDNQNYQVAASSTGACQTISDSTQAATVSMQVHQDCRSSLSSSVLNTNCPQ